MKEQENLRIVQEGYAAFKRGDVAAALANYADDIDWAMPGSPDVVPYAGKRRGREQVAQFYAAFAETEEVEQMEVQDFVAQEDKVLAFGHYRGRVRATTRSYTKDFIHAATLRDGKVVKFREYIASDDMHEAFNKSEPVRSGKGEMTLGTKQEESNLILRLYEIRREEVFRQARRWFAIEFNPQSAQDIISLMRSGHPESASYRMVTTYWEMAAALVTYGAIDEGLFHATNTEHMAIYAKVEPYLSEVRAAFGLPKYLAELEKVAKSAPGADEYFVKIRGLLKRWSEK